MGPDDCCGLEITGGEPQSGSIFQSERYWRERAEAAEAQLRRYSMSAGMADHYRGLALVACEALGLTSSCAPIDVSEAITALRGQTDGID